MKVTELPYSRITLEEVQARATKVIEAVRTAATVDDILAARQEMIALTKDYSTNAGLCYMRYSINTADEFYSAEKDYYDEIGPVIENLNYEYTCALLDSRLEAIYHRIRE